MPADMIEVTWLAGTDLRVKDSSPETPRIKASATTVGPSPTISKVACRVLTRCGREAKFDKYSPNSACDRKRARAAPDAETMHTPCFACTETVPSLKLSLIHI